MSIILAACMVLSLLPAGVLATTEQYVEFTVDALGLEYRSYSAGTNTVDGVGVEWIQLGHYDDGIQMRDKNGNTSMLWNTSALGTGITKIELTYSATKDVAYSNADAVIFNFGNEAKGATYSTKLSTTAGVKTYTITPNANTYTYFYVEHDLGYTFYWDSIKVYYTGTAAGGNQGGNEQPGGTTPEEPAAITIPDGEYVIVCPAYSKALSSNKALKEDGTPGFYNAGVDVTVSGSTVTGYGDTEKWVITNNADGSITISQNGQNLALAATFSSMNLGEVNDKWVLEDAGNGLYYVKNVVRGNYIQWYNQMNNWSSYGKISAGSEDLFALQLIGLKPCQHDYVVQVYPANCTEAGYTQYTCSLCGDSYIGDEVPSLGHSDVVDGVCTLCGKYMEPELNDSVYEIYTTGQLYWFAEQVNSGNTSINGKLMADIVVNENVLNADGTLNGDGSNFRVWTPIGYYNSYKDCAEYIGTFDGNGKTVSGLYFNAKKNYIGLFGYVGRNGVVTNVGVVDSYLSGSQYVGSVVGYNYDGTVSNCYNTGSVSGSKYVGGVVGYNYDGTVSNCYNTGSVSGSKYVGGVVGYKEYGTVSNCYNTGSVSGNYNVGGVVGYNHYGTVSNCYNTGSVSGFSCVGGVVGYNNHYGTVSNCYNIGSVSGEDNVGGVVGYNANTVSDCYNTGSVSGEDNVGGVVGYNGDYAGKCYNTGNISGTNYVGGVVGENVGTVSNCYNTGSVSGFSCVGGVVGYNMRKNNETACVMHCYNTGTVGGAGNFGGVVGKNDDTVTNCYYYEEEPNADVEGCTTAKTEEQFASGEVAYLLQGNQTEQIWGQEIGVEPRPVLDGETVLFVNGEYINCQHDYVAQVYPANCTDAGYTQHTCSLCGDSYITDEVEVNGQHNYVAQVYPANCTEAGYTQHTCSFCGDAYVVDEVPPIGHPDYSDYVDGFCTGCDKYEEPELNADVYEIFNAGQLYWFAQQVNSGNTSINGKLMADIVVNENVLKAGGSLIVNGSNFRVWTPIGYYITDDDCAKYIGTFDGNDKTISGLYFNDNSKDYVGLFGYVGSDGVVNNVGVVDSYFCGDYYIGGVVGYNTGTVTNCYNEGTLYSIYYVGGVVGKNNGTMTNCYNTGEIDGYDTVGGVVGYNASTMTNCYNTGSVGGAVYFGGVVGYNTGTVSGCYNTGWVGGNDKSGGYRVGGVVGENNGTVSNCYNTGKVDGYMRVGGVVGKNYRTVTNCYNTGSLYGVYYDGGVVGENNGTVTNCYYLSYYFGIGHDDGEEPNADVEGCTTDKTEEQFASGEVAFLLQGDQSEQIWGQKIGVDPSPVLDGEQVRFVNGEYINCQHDYVAQVYPANCTEDGYTQYTCSICGYSYIGDEVEANGQHDYVAQVYPANCTEAGYTQYTCETCGESYTDDATQATGHSFGQVTVHKPTPGNQGYSEHTCVFCGLVEQFDFVDVQGVSVSGQLASFLYGNATVELVQDGEVVYSTTATDGSYVFEGVVAGDYTLRVTKANHIPQEYAITVGDEDVAQDAKICPAGDVTGDGLVNIKDFQRLLRHVNKTNPLTDYALACGDVTGDGNVNIKDFQRLLRHVNKTNPLYPDKKDVTIKVWVAPEDISWLEQLQSRFEAEHPEYCIFWINEMMSPGDAGSAAINDPQKAADVYMYFNDQQLRLIEADGLAQLTDEYAQQVKDDNTQVVVDMVTHTDGEVYGLPVEGNTWILYYNKQVFTEEDVKNLDIMLEKGRVSLPFNSAWTAGALFLGCGGTLFGENGRDAQAGINFSEANGGYMAAKKMIELAQHPNAICGGLDVYRLINGEADAVFDGAWNYEYLKQELGDNLGIAVLPKFTIDGEEYQMTAVSGTKSVGVNAYADNGDGKLELCMEFASFMASAESQLLHYQLRNITPIHVDLAENEAVMGSDLAMAEISTIRDASVVQSYLNEMNYYWSPMYTFAEKIASGEINLDNYQEAVDELNELMNAQ